MLWVRHKSRAHAAVFAAVGMVLAAAPAAMAVRAETVPLVDAGGPTFGDHELVVVGVRDTGRDAGNQPGLDPAVFRSNAEEQVARIVSEASEYWSASTQGRVSLRIEHFVNFGADASSGARVASPGCGSGGELTAGEYGQMLISAAEAELTRVGIALDADDHLVAISDGTCGSSGGISTIEGAGLHRVALFGYAYAHDDPNRTCATSADPTGICKAGDWASSALAHEIGHTLGFAHTYDTCLPNAGDPLQCTAARTTNAGTTLREYGADDVMGLGMHRSALDADRMNPAALRNVGLLPDADVAFVATTPDGPVRLVAPGVTTLPAGSKRAFAVQVAGQTWYGAYKPSNWALATGYSRPFPAGVALYSTRDASCVHDCTTQREVPFPIVAGTSWNVTPSGPTITVRSVDAGGADLYIHAAPGRAPGAPQVTSLVPGRESITATWTAGAAGTTPTDAYIATATATGAPSATCTTTGATSCTFTGLAPGYTYRVQVEARNSYGSSTSALSTAGALVPVVPGAPRSVSLIRVAPTPLATSTALDVVWNAPASEDGGRAVTSYSIVTEPALTSCLNLPPTARACRLAGLQFGQLYSIKVYAHNAAGSAYAPGTYTAYNQPSAPTGLTATPGNGQITVAWTPPTYTGGGIYKYVIWKIRGTAIEGQPAEALAPNTSYTFTGLTNGVRYGFIVQVCAGNTMCQAPYTSSTQVNATAGLPGAPTGLTVVPSGTTGAKATWFRSTSAGTGPSTSYRVDFTAGTTVKSCTATAPTTTCTVTGLSSTAVYTVTVRAFNGTAAGPTVTAAKMVGRPAAATGVRTTRTGTYTARINWVAPASNGTPTVTKSVVTLSATGSLKTCTAYGTATLCNVSGLTRGKTYTVKVQSYNMWGAGGIAPGATYRVP